MLSPPFLAAADPANFLAANTDVLVGRSLGRGWVDDRTGVLVGRDLAMRLGFKVGDDIAIDSPSFRAAGASGPVRFVVSALYDVRDQAYPSYGVVIHEQLIRPNGQENVSQGANAIMVLLKSRDQASLVSQFIDTSYRASPVPTRTTLREEFVESFSQQGAGLTSLLRLYGLGGLASAALLLGTFFYYASRRLERSISVLRLLGFGRRRILLAVAAAMSLSAGAGAAIGVALTFICLAMFKVAIEQAFTAFSVRLVDGLVAVPVAAFAAFLASALIMVLLLRNPAGISTADGDWA